MANLGRLPHGMFCWVELNTTNPAAARGFYTKVMGWTARDEPGPPGMPYTIFQFGEHEVAAMVGLPEHMANAGVPSHWRSYVSVDNCDETTSRVAELGGEVMMGPLDAHDKGRMSLVKDPHGASFALWEAKGHAGAARYNEPGCLCWNELFTTDPEAALEFYQGLFGWGVSKSEMTPGSVYYEWKIGERGVGGMMQIAAEWGPVPPHWNLYFSVEDMAAWREKAKAAGAQEKMPPVSFEMGQFLMLDDPQGAGFTALEMLPGKADGQPPRAPITG